MALLPSAGANDPTTVPGSRTGGGILDNALNALDPAKVRTKIAGLLPGGISSVFDKSSTPSVAINSNTGKTSTIASTDWRVKIGLPANSGIFYNDPSNQLLAILKRTNGAVFPYTPSITVTNNARYQEQALTHSNYKNYFYEGSDVAAINITGDFAVQNVDDGLYLLAVIYFFRSVTKMFFGGNDGLTGNPPPVVYLDGYGDFYFPHVSCIVTSFQHTMPADVDYLEVPYTNINSNTSAPETLIARLPTTSQISVTVQPIYSRNFIHNSMNLRDFSNGKLLGFI
jgi:hypothetical protein